MTIHVPADMIDHFRHRVIQDAMQEATAIYWERRARQLEAGLPRPGDRTFAADPSEIEERSAAVRQAAENCRNHARLIRGLV